MLLVTGVGRSGIAAYGSDYASCGWRTWPLTSRLLLVWRPTPETVRFWAMKVRHLAPTLRRESDSSIAAAILSLLIVVCGASSPALAAQEADPAILAELDTYWAEISRTVAEGDFDAYAASYHPDGVLVSGDKTTPIAEALRNWQSGFVETREGRSRPQVDFRFTRRAHDPTTAHEIGIFRFTARAAGGEPSVEYIHFEALMVKRAGVWLMLMENQKGPATREEWDSAR